MRLTNRFKGVAYFASLIILPLIFAIGWQIMFSLRKASSQRFRHSVQRAIIVSQFRNVISDIDRHRYQLIPQKIAGAFKYGNSFLNVKAGIMYLTLDPTTFMVVKNYRDGNLLVCPKQVKNLRVKMFLMVGANGFCLGHSSSVFDLSNPTCRDLPLEPKASPLVPCQLQKSQTVIIHPVFKEYILYVGHDRTLRKASFENGLLYENQVVMTNVDISNIEILYLQKTNTLSISIKSATIKAQLFNALPRKPLHDLLMDPMLL
ncbi:MAG: hypothetical protein NZT61_02865 [Deltaproteobacteria bacterium]|nr:hypothetical protein [Deltaproteobacteria bacterium]